MRVLIVTGSYPPMRCGIGDYSQGLAQVLAITSGNQVGILTSVFATGANKLGGIEMFPVISRWSLSEIVKVIKVIRDWSPDIVHIQYPTQGYGNSYLPWVLPMVSFLMGKKVVQTWHEGYSRRNALWLFLKSIVPGRLVFVRPNFIEENLHAQLGWAIWGKTPIFIPNASSIPRAELSEHEKIEIKKQYLNGRKRLIVFFGFVYPAKGVELLFEIADPASDQIVIAGEITENDVYPSIIKRLASTGIWQGKTTIAGFLPAADIAALLAVADAVILPFRGRGGGQWNTSIHGTVLNGAFLITTSQTQSGYDKKSNVYYARVDNVQEMRNALVTYAGIRREYHADIDRDEWQRIAGMHSELYASLLTK